MKPSFAILAVLPGLFFVGPAQADPSAPPTPSNAARENLLPRVDSEGSLRLLGGPLKDVIGQIEQLLPALKEFHARNGDDYDATMPNIVFNPDAANAVVAAPRLHLRNVTPIDALTLAASAAGCSLKGIYAPGSEGNASNASIIGYRVEILRTPPNDGAGRFGGPAAGGRLPGADNSGSSENPRPHKNTFTRVYGFQSYFRGDLKESNERYQMLDHLIDHAFDVAKEGRPRISFHNLTSTFIVVGTQEQHEIFQQIHAAFRENEAPVTDAPKR